MSRRVRKQGGKASEIGNEDAGKGGRVSMRAREPGGSKERSVGGWVNRGKDAVGRRGTEGSTRSPPLHVNDINGSRTTHCR